MALPLHVFLRCDRCHGTCIPNPVNTPGPWSPPVPSRFGLAQSDTLKQHEALRGPVTRSTCLPWGAPCVCRIVLFGADHVRELKEGQLGACYLSSFCCEGVCHGGNTRLRLCSGRGAEGRPGWWAGVIMLGGGGTPLFFFLKTV